MAALIQVVDKNGLITNVEPDDGKFTFAEIYKLLQCETIALIYRETYILAVDEAGYLLRRYPNPWSFAYYDKPLYGPILVMTHDEIDADV